MSTTPASERHRSQRLQQGSIFSVNLVYFRRRLKSPRFHPAEAVNHNTLSQHSLRNRYGPLALAAKANSASVCRFRPVTATTAFFCCTALARQRKQKMQKFRQTRERSVQPFGVTRVLRERTSGRWRARGRRESSCQQLLVTGRSLVKMFKTGFWSIGRAGRQARVSLYLRQMFKIG